ncbi:hypothetical protein A15D_03354 [Alcanivorax sp. MD8A]|uniref:DUF3108 domain-containing protein n=2 Tax=Gammaproteobacteria TaxID=1236 RepID=UPI000CBC2FBB|nr:DUF3108 domain-containing protein [Alcanivorax sp. MD8A]MEE2869829.1 DUF3108 domain-containing protein [Pseudomonadota bacterium]PNE01073.1 hypothetical protein A15D_03354 [Alcanivorax sp. MD8A]
MAHHTLLYRSGRLLGGLLLVAGESVLAQPVIDDISTIAAPAYTFPGELPPAQARYRVVVNGIPVGMDATITLTPHPKGYQLQFQAENRFFRHQEVAIFDWNNCTARPHHYRHASAGFGIKREGEIEFDWDAGQANGSKAVYPLADDALDALSVAMMARCNMARAEQSFEYAVAEPDGMDTYQYRFMEAETLETPAGKWQTVSVERDYPERGRRSRFWAARELEYFMVRMDHQENPFIRGRIELTEFRYLSGEEIPSPDRQSGSTVTSR